MIFRKQLKKEIKQSIKLHSLLPSLHFISLKLNSLVLFYFCTGLAGLIHRDIKPTLCLKSTCLMYWHAFLVLNIKH